MTEPRNRKPAKAASEKAKNARAKASPRPFARPRGGEAKVIGDLMPEVGRAAFRRFGFVQSAVVTRWSEIVGARYADVTMPQSIRFPAGSRADGTLMLTVSGAHAPFIQHVVPDIIERVNRFFGYGAVARVKMVQGEIPRRDDPSRYTPARPAAPPSLKPVSFELGQGQLGQGLREIADPELAAVLESLARQVAGSDRK